MIYSNFPQIEEIMKQISALNYQLTDLGSLNLTVKISSNNYSPYHTLYTIEMESENEYKEDAELLVERIRHKIKNKIADLKKQLEPL